MKVSSTYLFEKIDEHVDLKKPLVCYRLPGQSELKAFFQIDRQIYQSNRFEESGFIFAPFNLSRHNTVVIPAEKSDFYTASYSVSSNTEVNEVAFEDTNEIAKEKSYVKLVEQCKSFLKTSNTQKVVLSREIITKTDQHDQLLIFRRLLDDRSNAMVYFWYHPKVGLWIGATPESLLHLQGNEFETMSLAGTKVYNQLEKVRWTDKEKREQKYVTDFILERVSKFMNRVKTSETQTVVAGNVAHQCTIIKGALDSKTSLYDLISNLHPTPAVCGVPQESAMDYIINYEGYDRKYYTGFLGEVNLNEATNLFVNLRCLEAYEDSYSIYVGGGITSDSNAVDEWQETVEKSKVIKKALAHG